MKKRYVLPGGYYSNYRFLAVSDEISGEWKGCDTAEEAQRFGLERWGEGNFEVEECLLADGVSSDGVFLLGRFVKLCLYRRNNDEITRCDMEI